MIVIKKKVILCLKNFINLVKKNSSYKKRNQNLNFFYFVLVSFNKSENLETKDVCCGEEQKSFVGELWEKYKEYKNPPLPPPDKKCIRIEKKPCEPKEKKSEPPCPHETKPKDEEHYEVDCDACFIQEQVH